MSTKHVTCRYYIHGVCREGSRCLFSHDLTTSKPSTICKFYQRGTCAYGERCRYDHIKPSFRAGGGGASDEPPSVGGTTDTGGGPSNEFVGVSGAPRRRGGGAKKPLVLRDRDMCVSGVCSDAVPGGGACRPEPEVAAPHSYVAAIRAGLRDEGPPAVGGASSSQLCPFAAAGNCYYGEGCPYLHGDRCDVCGLQVLHPTNQEQRTAHEKMCLLMFEVDMEKAFAAQLSEDKVCSICMELVVQKSSPSERRFGILSSCCHIFCLSCIRRWRCSPNFSNSIIKSCPECRVASEFVIPSATWVEDQEQKDHLIEVFKSGTSKKSCKYFAEGRGTCPFGSRCLYLHAFPDGTRAEPDAPRKQLSSAGNVRFMNNVRLWDFIEEREQRSAPPLDDDMTELRAVFMQMSHDDTPPTDDQ